MGTGERERGGGGREHAHATLHTRSCRGHPPEASPLSLYPFSCYLARCGCTKRPSPREDGTKQHPPRHARGTLIQFDSNRQGCTSLASLERHRRSKKRELLRNIGRREIARGNLTQSAAAQRQNVPNFNNGISTSLKSRCSVRRLQGRSTHIYSHLRHISESPKTLAGL